MSGRLVAEVLDHAPTDLTAGQMLVLVALAEAARDKDRQARFNCSVEELVFRTRLQTSTVRNALQNLKGRGLIRPVHARVAKGGKHQEYVIARLNQAHRFATHRDPKPPPPGDAS